MLYDTEQVTVIHHLTRDQLDRVLAHAHELGTDGATDAEKIERRLQAVVLRYALDLPDANATQRS